MLPPKLFFCRIGRLKPIYCDRLDNKILRPSAPVDIVHETDATALVDCNMGLGLNVGPTCMRLAIDKAKKHGIGCVIARNSTHFGIAGYVLIPLSPTDMVLCAPSEPTMGPLPSPHMLSDAP